MQPKCEASNTMEKLKEWKQTVFKKSPEQQWFGKRERERKNERTPLKLTCFAVAWALACWWRLACIYFFFHITFRASKHIIVSQIAALRLHRLQRHSCTIESQFKIIICRGMILIQVSQFVCMCACTRWDRLFFVGSNLILHMFAANFVGFYNLFDVVVVVVIFVVLLH